MKQMLLSFENQDEALITDLSKIKRNRVSHFFFFELRPYFSTVVLSTGHILFLISPSKTFSKQALDQSGRRILNEYLPSTTITDTR